jgi:hypothetical protein
MNKFKKKNLNIALEEEPNNVERPPTDKSSTRH